MNEVRFYNTLKSYRNTEKSVRIADKYKQITFKVARDATKIDIKFVVEKMFSVIVTSVNIINVKGKTKKFKQIEGKRQDWKKAILSLKEGHDINLAEFK